MSPTLASIIGRVEGLDGILSSVPLELETACLRHANYYHAWNVMTCELSAPFLFWITFVMHQACKK